MSWIDKFNFYAFDLDGLVINTEPRHFEAYKKACAFFGCTLDWSFDRYVEIAHLSNEGLRKNILPILQKNSSCSWEAFYAEKKRQFEEIAMNSNISLMRGVEKLLKILKAKNKKICVVTNSNRRQVEILRKKHEVLLQLEHWVTREDYPNPKPAPDGYLKAIELYGEENDRMIGFEDTLKGFEALRLSGIKPVLICRKDHPQLKKMPEALHFESFEEISFL